MRRLDGKVAIVTGAGRGIGRGIAERFAQEGARVVVNDLDAAAAEEAAAAIGATAVAADVSSAADVARLFEAAPGPVDVIVNNAGLTDVSRHVLDGDEAWWDEILGVNLKGQFLCALRAAGIMSERGGGAIVNVSSVGATAAHRGMVAYDASKGGVEAMTRALAVDLAPYGIRVNALAPGDIEVRSAAPDDAEPRARTVPLGRIGRPADLAGPAVFLASDDARYVTGVTIAVDGGLTAQLRPPQVDPPPARRG